MPPETATASPLPAGLLPSCVVSRATGGDLLDGTRFAVEEAVVSAAVASRRREFVTTRACARLALRELGFGEVAIPRGPSGDPIWPAGVVGSLTHCAGYRAAAVALRRGPIGGVGIDAEPAEPLPPDVLALIADPVERARLIRLGEEDPSVPWDRLLFSTKESVYKAQFPITGRWLDFADVRVKLDRAGRFSAWVAAPTGTGPVEVPTGRWGMEDGILATAVVWRSP